MKQFFIDIGISTMGRKDDTEVVPLTDEEEKSYLIAGILAAVVVAGFSFYLGCQHWL